MQMTTLTFDPGDARRRCVERSEKIPRNDLMATEGDMQKRKTKPRTSVKGNERVCVRERSYVVFVCQEEWGKGRKKAKQKVGFLMETHWRGLWIIFFTVDFFYGVSGLAWNGTRLCAIVLETSWGVLNSLFEHFFKL